MCALLQNGLRVMLLEVVILGTYGEPRSGSMAREKHQQLRQIIKLRCSRSWAWCVTLLVLGCFIVPCRLLVDTHADDDYGTGPESAVSSFLAEYGQMIKFKSSVVYGLWASYSHLRRPRERTPEGMKIRANIKHLDRALAFMGMSACASCLTPMVSEAKHDEEDVDPLVEPRLAQQFRAVVMLLVYYTQDVFEAQYADEELARDASKLHESSVQRSKRL